MGFRTYLYSMPKKLADEIRGMTISELKIKFNNPDLYAFNIPKKELYEFGKYTEFSDDIIDNSTCFFLNLETHKWANDDDYFYLANEEAFKIAIDYYKNQVKSYYNHIIEKCTSDNIEEVKSCLKNNLSEWDYDLAINMDKKIKAITHSWKYEYSIFELVRLYKTFNWKKDVLIFAGY